MFPVVAVAAVLAWALPVSAAGLVAYYPLDAGTGTTAYDVVGGRDGTLQANAAWSTGKNGTGTGIALDGSSTSFVTTPAVASALNIDGAKPKTVSLWAKVDQWQDDGLFDLGNYSGQQDFSLRTVGSTTNHFRAQFWSGDNDFDVNGTNQGVGGTQVKPADGNWVNYVMRYDGQTVRVFADGVVVMTANHNLNTADNIPFHIGWYNNTGNTLKGAVDDVAIWDTALPFASIAALAKGTGTPQTVAVVEGDIPGPLGGNGYFGIREVKGNGPLTSVDDAELSLRLGGGTAVNYTAPMVNMIDPDNSGGSGHFGRDATLATNAPGDDNDIALIAKGNVRIVVEDDYTFGYYGDDGSRLRLPGQTFTSFTGVSGTSINGDTLQTPRMGGGINALGVVHLTPGLYPIEYLWFEHTGGANVELYAAQGAKTGFDGDFRPIGYQAGPIAASEFDVVVIRDGGVSNIAQATAQVEAYWASGTGTNVTPATATTINFYDPDNAGGGGRFGFGDPFPGDVVGTDENNFSLGATSTIEIFREGTYTFGVNSDDGVRLRILGTSGWTGWNGASALADGFSFNGSGADRGGTVYLTPGEYDMELIFVENAGGAYVDLWASYGATTGYDSFMQLIGGPLDIDGLQLEEVPEPVSMALMGLSLTGLAGYIRRRRKA